MEVRFVRAVIAFIAVVCLSSIAFAQRMPRGSFLLTPVQSRYQLVQQVQVDPEVSMRYQRHFGMTQDEVVHYFSTLRTTTLEEPATYTVWYTRPGSDVYYSKSLRLRAGEPVFVDQSNRVVLRLKCGNPMVTREVAREYYTTYVKPTLVETTTIEQRAQPIDTRVEQQTTTVTQVDVQPTVTRIDLQPIVRTHQLTWEDAAAVYVLAEAMDVTPDALIAMRTTDLASTRFIDLGPALLMSWHAKQPVATIWTDHSSGTTWTDLATRHSLPTTYWNSEMATTTGWTDQDFTTHFWQSLLLNNLSVPNTDIAYFGSQSIPMEQWLVASVIGRQFNLPAQHVMAAYTAADNNWDTVVANFTASPPTRTTIP